MSAKRCEIDTINDKVARERLRLLYAHGLSALAVNVVGGALLVPVINGHVPPHGLTSWATVFFAACALRGILYWAKQHAGHALSARAWLTLFAISTLLSAAMWGATALLLFPTDAVDQLVIAGTIIAMVAGAAASISCVPWLYAAYLALSFLPVAIRFGIETKASPLMVIMALLFCCGMSLAARTNYRLLRSSLILRFENEALARQLEALASRDALTGLANRHVLEDQLEQAIRRARRFDSGVAVVFVDCDGFKAVNDTYGHATGDRYLQHLASALEEAVRDIDIVARMGGDEFVIMLDGVGTQSQATTIIERIRSRACREASIDGQLLVPQLSMGLAMFPRDAADAASLIRVADQAMYAQKRGAPAPTALPA